MHGLRIREAFTIFADLAQEPRRELGTGTGQRGEEIVIWMLSEQRFDPLAMAQAPVGPRGSGGG